MSVQILLATFNGARFLEQQLDSLLNQTYSDWCILARDDGSTDSTLDILKAFAKANPGRLELLEDQERGLGAKGNFARLLEHSTAPYIMFCDQDDVWLPQKVELTLTRMKALEDMHGEQTPLLVHTDLEVVNSDLQRIDFSFWRYQNLDPKVGEVWSRLLIQNMVTGCTTMLNRPLVKTSLPIPQEAIMHDWWIAIIAGLLGHIEAVPKATMLYRQHGKNDTGAKRWDWQYILKKTLSFYDTETLFKSIKAACNQAKPLQRYFYRLDPKTQQIIVSFSTLEDMGFWERRIFLLRHRILKIGYIRNIGLLLRV